MMVCTLIVSTLATGQVRRRMTSYAEAVRLADRYRICGRSDRGHRTEIARHEEALDLSGLSGEQPDSFLAQMGDG